MFKLDEVKELLALLDESSIQEFEIESEGMKLKVRKGAAEVVHVPAMPAQVLTSGYAGGYGGELRGNGMDAPAALATAATEPAAPARPAGIEIKSPMVGTFYCAPSPDAPPFVNIGDHVNEKTVVCILEAMKLMNELEAEVKGEIVDILVKNGDLVEFGEPLFIVKPD